MAKQLRRFNKSQQVSTASFPEIVEPPSWFLKKQILGELQRLQHFQQVQLVKEKSVAYLLIIEVHNLINDQTTKYL